MPTLTDQSTLTRKQVKVFGPRLIAGYGKNALIEAEVRYDDECNNGHNTFAITAKVYIPGQRDIEAGGCMHEAIAEHFPELAKFIKWHLCSSDGPISYVANTLYLAGNRDCWHKLKGEPYAYETHIHFGQNPNKHKFGKKFTQFLLDAKSHPGSERFDFEVIGVPHEKRNSGTHDYSLKYTFGGFGARWHECPFDTEAEAQDFLTALQTCDPQFTLHATQWGKGKERELDAARRSAIWPDATDEELTADGLEERLNARLPRLLAEFRADVASFGFVW